MPGQPQLAQVLDRLSRDLAGQPAPSVMDALRVDEELAIWGWTDLRLSFWAHQIAASEPAIPPTNRGIAD